MLHTLLLTAGPYCGCGSRPALNLIADRMSSTCRSWRLLDLHNGKPIARRNLADIPLAEITSVISRVVYVPRKLTR